MRLYGLVRRSIEADPGPWLVAGCAFLAALVWHLPAPAFLFASDGSGSGGGTPCTCSTANCDSWELLDPDLHPEVEGANPQCTTSGDGGWEHCVGDLNYRIDCVKEPPGVPVEHDKKLPRSKFIYEQAPTWCENTTAHDGAGDLVQWGREVTITSAGTSGFKKVEFKPKFEIEFGGFTDGNVCVGSVGQIDFGSGLFAALRVCPPGNDPNLRVLDESKGATGWSYVSHDFKKNGTWKFVAGTNPYTESFAISRECPCSASNNVEQWVTFSSSIEVNTGVKFGANQTDASVTYRLTEDTTTCTVRNP